MFCVGLNVGSVYHPIIACMECEQRITVCGHVLSPLAATKPDSDWENSSGISRHFYRTVKKTSVDQSVMQPTL